MAMSLDEMLENVSVIGAAGKMGRGIAALMAIEIVNTRLRVGDPKREYRLNLVDIDYGFLKDAISYIETQVSKWGEKNIEELRNLYREFHGGELPQDLIHNRQIIDRYLADIRSIIISGTDTTRLVEDSRVVFEAMIEDEGLKIETLKVVKRVAHQDVLVLTNTSSIPIKVLEDYAGLNGNIMSFHFYNPPPAQELLEVARTKKTIDGHANLALQLGKRLGKKVVEVNDIAGFIGNGHFMREFIYATKEVKRLTTAGMGTAQAIYVVNEVTNQYLMRRMGIFQLMDYVGIDVIQKIMVVMNKYISGEDIHSSFIDRFIEKGVKGGQNPDGSQRNGFFTYKGTRALGVFDSETNGYKMFSGDTKPEWYEEINEDIKAQLPEGNLTYKGLASTVDKDAVLKGYFRNLGASDKTMAQIAKNYLVESARIAQKLVDDGVARAVEDVTKVLTLGFVHLYGPTQYAPLIQRGE